MSSFFCADISRDIGEALVGTAPRGDVWFALEYPDSFGARAFEESNLPAAVKIRLAEVLAAVPNSRLRLIRKGRHFAGDGISFFAAVCHEEEPNLYEFKLSAYDDLLALDFPGIIAEQRAFWQYDRTEPLFLVCVNGRRDACCAKYGQAFYQAMAACAGENVWQASHIGGHRFAPTLVTLPHGLYYGALTLDDAQTIVAHTRQKRVHLPKYRGRSCYDNVVQAAAIFLRQQSGNIQLGQFKLIEMEAVRENEWLLHFRELPTSMAYCVQLRREPGDAEVYKSCGDVAPVRPPRYLLVDYAAHPGMGRYS